MSHNARRALGIEPGAGLVEEQNFGLVGDGAGNLDALGEAAGEGLDERLGALGELEELEQFVGLFRRLGVRHAEVAAVEVDVLPDGALAVEGIELGDDAHVAAGLGGMLDDVDSGDGDLARSGQRAGGADADGGAFARAVGAEQTEELAAPDREVDALDGLDRDLAGIGLHELLNVDDGVSCHF